MSVAKQQLQEVDAFLLGIPLFAAIDEITRFELAEQLEPAHVAAGDVVLRQGDPGDGRAELTGWLHAVERDHDHVIYQPDGRHPVEPTLPGPV